MEDTLRVMLDKMMERLLKVLILVLMEDTLRELEKPFQKMVTKS